MRKERFFCFNINSIKRHTEQRRREFLENVLIAFDKYIQEASDNGKTTVSVPYCAVYDSEKFDKELERRTIHSS